MESGRERGPGGGDEGWRSNLGTPRNRAWDSNKWVGGRVWAVAPALDKARRYSVQGTIRPWDGRRGVSKPPLLGSNDFRRRHMRRRAKQAASSPCHFSWNTLRRLSMPSAMQIESQSSLVLTSIVRHPLRPQNQYGFLQLRLNHAKLPHGPTVHPPCKVTSVWGDSDHLERVPVVRHQELVTTGC